MSELRLINKTTCDFVYVDKAVQLSKYALYLTEGRFVGQFQFINLIKEENITEVTLKIAAYDSFERLVSEFECTIHRSNNLDSNEKFGDNSPIYIKGQDIGKIVPEIVSYSTADKTVDYSDATKVTFEREKKVRYIFDESEIEFLNNKFNYGLKSYLVLPQKLSKTIYLDKDGELKHYEGAFPYEDMYKLNESEEFQEDKVEFENSFGYMTKHLLTTLTDSEKRTKYFSMIKADKKLFKRFVIGVIVAVIILGGCIYAKVSYDAVHQYDGIWVLWDDKESGYLEINGDDVTYYDDMIDQSDVYEDLYEEIYYGKRDGNKITYTKHKSMPYHPYYESYSADDYQVENDYKETVKFKKLSNGEIEIDGYLTFSKSDEY